MTNAPSVMRAMALPEKSARKFVKSLRSQHCFCKIQQGFFTTKPFPEDCFFSPRLFKKTKGADFNQTKSGKNTFHIAALRGVFCSKQTNFSDHEVFRKQKQKIPLPKMRHAEKKIFSFVKTEKNIRMNLKVFLCFPVSFFCLPFFFGWNPSAPGDKK